MNPKNHKVKKLWIILFLVIFGILLYFPYLGIKEFEGEEGRRVFIALEMLEKREFLIPKIFDTPYFNKPPLFNWTLAFVFYLTKNHSEFIARATSATLIIFNSIFLSIIWCKILIYTPLYEIVKNKNILEKLIIFSLPGLIFQTIPEIIDKAIKAEIESIYILVISLALFSWFYLYEILKKKILASIISGIFLELGILTKTFHAIVFFYISVFPYLIFQKKLKKIFFIYQILTILIFLNIFLIWAILINFSGITFIEFIKAWIIQYETNVITSEKNFFHHLKSYTWGALTGLSPWIFFLIFYRNKDLKSFIKKYKELYKLCLFSFFLFSFSFLLHFLLPNAKLRYIAPSISGFTYLVSIPILWTIINNKKNLYFVNQIFLLFFPILFLILLIIFMIFLWIKNLFLIKSMYLFLFLCIIINFLILIYKKYVKYFSFYIIILYLIFLIFLLKQIYISFYFYFHKTYKNELRNASINISKILSDQKEIYFCKIKNPHLAYYLKYNLNTSKKIYYTENCNINPDSWVLAPQNYKNNLKITDFIIYSIKVHDNNYILFKKIQKDI